jgi:hypothetical protein
MEMVDIRTTVLTAMKEGLGFAAEYLLMGEQALDAHTWGVDDIPVDEKYRLLDLLRHGAEFTSNELEQHIGTAPIPADRRTHLVMADVIRRHFPHSFVVGEEATESEWELAENAPVGALIFTLDAIDGSAPYDTLTFGYSSNVLVHERHEHDDELLMAAVANSSGFVALYEAPDTVIVGTLEAQSVITEPLSTDFREGSIAILAASPRHRALASSVMNDDTLTTFTTGGAPAALGIIIGRLSALAATEHQTMWDTAFLPIVAFLGVPIHARTGLVLGLHDVTSFFIRVARTPEDRTARPVPPFVIARNPAFGARLMTLL